MGKVLSTMSKEGFEKLSTDGKLVVLFENQQMHLELCADRCADCKKKFERLEQRKYFDKAISGVAGFVGGFIAGLTKLNPFDLFKG